MFVGCGSSSGDTDGLLGAGIRVPGMAISAAGSRCACLEVGDVVIVAKYILKVHCDDWERQAPNSRAKGGRVLGCYRSKCDTAEEVIPVVLRAVNGVNLNKIKVSMLKELE